MARDSEATLVDTWGLIDAGDDEHQAGWPHEPSRETARSHNRFDLSTQRATGRRRIPLASRGSARVVKRDADPPPPPRQPVAEGSSPDVFRLREGGASIPVEVRLRRDLAPSPAQVDDVVAWLRTHRIPRGDARGTPRPAPTPPPQLAPTPPPAPAPEPLLEPAVRVESVRPSLWPLLAVSVGLATALLAAIVL